MDQYRIPSRDRTQSVDNELPDASILLGEQMLALCGVDSNALLFIDQGEKDFGPTGRQRCVADPDSEEADSGADSEALLVTARDLRKRAEELLKKGIKPDDATEIETLIRLSTEAIPRQDWPALQDQCNKLSDLIFYLED